MNIALEKFAARVNQAFEPSVFSSVSHRCFICYALTAALSIGLSQLFIIAILAYWLLLMAFRPVALRSEAAQRLSRPIIAWLLTCYLAAIFGVNFPLALKESLKTSLYVLIPFCLLTSLTCLKLNDEEFLQRVRTYLVALICSQSLAAIHTLVSAAFQSEIPPKIPGPVTESGQLVLVLPCLIGFFFYRQYKQSNSTENPPLPKLLSGLLLLCLLIISWPLADYADAVYMQLTASILATALLVCMARNQLSNKKFSFRGFIDSESFLWIAGTLLLAALFINLKRGPWLGTLVVSLLFGTCLSRKLFINTLILSFLALMLFSPIQYRMLHLADHFSIDGGRQNMWEMGMELAERFPLGLGPNNARFMQKLNPSLPELHRHMHSNPLNVVVETGWIGLAAYLWWMWVAISMGWILWRRLKKSDDALVCSVGVLSLSLSLALLGWQTAGLVEYNFGDGEIRMIAFFFMGLLLSLDRFDR